MEPGQRGMKDNRGFGIKRHIDLANGFVTIEVAVDSAQRHRLLRVSQLNAD